MKKFLIIVLFLILIFTSFISTTNAITVTNDSLTKNISKLNSALDNSNPGYLTKIVDDKGNVPAYEYYPNHVASRSIKTLKAYDGKIFMGLGDWNDNTGPAKVIYYDTTDGKIKSSGTINDEAIQIFNIIDDKIYTTGCDPKDAWGYGSYYIYNKETNAWDKHMKNDGWIHVFNIVEFKNKLYMCGSTVDTMKESTIQVSADNGETFESIPVYKNDKVLPYDSSLRCYNLVVLNNKLYGYIYYSSYNGIYEYDEANNRFDYISNLPNVLTSYSDSSPFYNKVYLEHTIFNDTFIYPYSTILYSSKDLKTFSSLKTGMNGTIRTAIVANDTLYCLTYDKVSKNNTYTTRIYSTKDLSIFNLVYEFTSEAQPFTLEYYDNSFYVGTGYSSWDSVPTANKNSNGMLYKITLNNNKKSVGLDTANTLIKILNNNVENSNAKYSLSNEITTFTSTLTFNNTMSVEQLRKEYNKINDFALMFSTVAYEADVVYLDSAPYFNNAISEKLANLYTIASTGVEFAKSAFTEDLNIEDKLFTLKSTKISETENEYQVEITLTINNSGDFSTLKQKTSSSGGGLGPIIMPDGSNSSNNNSNTNNNIQNNNNNQINNTNNNTNQNKPTISGPSVQEVLIVPPSKTNYKVGEKLDLTGLKITAIFSNNAIKDVTKGYTVKGYNKNKEGSQTITISYKGFSRSYTVKVRDNSTNNSSSPSTNTNTNINNNVNLEFDNIIANDKPAENKNSFELKNLLPIILVLSIIIIVIFIIKKKKE